jgi:hypothetical protein
MLTAEDKAFDEFILKNGAILTENEDITSDEYILPETSITLSDHNDLIYGDNKVMDVCIYIYIYICICIYIYTYIFMVIIR